MAYLPVSVRVLPTHATAVHPAPATRPVMDRGSTSTATAAGRTRTLAPSPAAGRSSSTGSPASSSSATRRAAAAGTTSASGSPTAPVEPIGRGSAERRDAPVVVDHDDAVSRQDEQEVDAPSRASSTSGLACRRARVVSSSSCVVAASTTARRGACARPRRPASAGRRCGALIVGAARRVGAIQAYPPRATVDAPSGTRSTATCTGDAPRGTYGRMAAAARRRAPPDAPCGRCPRARPSDRAQALLTIPPTGCPARGWPGGDAPGGRARRLGAARPLRPRRRRTRP